MRVVEARTPILFRARRLRLILEIVQHPLAGTRLAFYCAMPQRLTPHSKFYRSWSLANGGPPRRGDRLALRVFKDRLFLGQVVDVTRDRHQRKLARPYSVVVALVERMA